MMAEAQLLSRDGEPQRDHYVHLHGVTWADYQKLQVIRGERRLPKIAYFKGTLELMTKSRAHERIKSRIGQLVETWCVESGIECTAYGEWTLEDERVEGASEPDECYVLGYDPERKARPDLIIEVVLTSGGIDKLDIYHALRIPEVWFWKRGRIHVYVRRTAAYEAVEASEVLPGLDLEELVSFLDRSTTSQSIREYQKALRKKARRRSTRGAEK